MKISTKQIQITFFTIAGVGLALLISECVVLERKNERWHQENQHIEAEVKKHNCHNANGCVGSDQKIHERSNSNFGEKGRIDP